jgi:hypothetical protein
VRKKPGAAACSANISAQLWPIPLVAPITKAHLFFSLPSLYRYIASSFASPEGSFGRGGV